MTSPPKAEIQKRAEAIKTIHHEYTHKLEKLKKRQAEIADELTEKLKKEKRSQRSGMRRWGRKITSFFRGK